MATPFSYANTITAGTPMVAAEVQGNFDDIADHLDTYYQQTADTTAEIAAAIAANPGGAILVGWGTAPVNGSPVGNSFVAVDVGPPVTWTATTDHIYMVVYHGFLLQLSTAADYGYRQAYISRALNGGPGSIVWRTTTETVTTSSAGGSATRPANRDISMDSSFFLTGLSGSTTLQLEVQTFCSTGSPTDSMLTLNGYVAVFDLGEAP